MKALFLYGINCTERIWDALLPLLPSWDCEILPYPHDVTQKAAYPRDLAEWVSQQAASRHYDVIVGHSLGGVIALEAAAAGRLAAERIICLDTNLRPAGTFFRNLMTEPHMALFGTGIRSMMAAERPYYTAELIESLQKNFDYTQLLDHITVPVWLLMGDRGQADAHVHLPELDLPTSVLEKLHIAFIPDACHLPMIENPRALAECLGQICSGKACAVQI